MKTLFKTISIIIFSILINTSLFAHYWPQPTPLIPTPTPLFNYQVEPVNILREYNYAGGYRIDDFWTLYHALDVTNIDASLPSAFRAIQSVIYDYDDNSTSVCNFLGGVFDCVAQKIPQSNLENDNPHYSGSLSRVQINDIKEDNGDIIKNNGGYIGSAIGAIGSVDTYEYGVDFQNARLFAPAQVNLMMGGNFGVTPDLDISKSIGVGSAIGLQGSVSIARHNDPDCFVSADEVIGGRFVVDGNGEELNKPVVITNLYGLKVELSGMNYNNCSIGNAYGIYI